MSSAKASVAKAPSFVGLTLIAGTRSTHVSYEKLWLLWLSCFVNSFVNDKGAGSGRIMSFSTAEPFAAFCGKVGRITGQSRSTQKCHRKFCWHKIRYVIPARSPLDRILSAWMLVFARWPCYGNITLLVKCQSRGGCSFFTFAILYAYDYITFNEMCRSKCLKKEKKFVLKLSTNNPCVIQSQWTL